VAADGLVGRVRGCGFAVAYKRVRAAGGWLWHIHNHINRRHTRAQPPRTPDDDSAATMSFHPSHTAQQQHSVIHPPSPLGVPLSVRPSPPPPPTHTPRAYRQAAATCTPPRSLAAAASPAHPP
jgi:hypothetical protein